MKKMKKKKKKETDPFCLFLSLFQSFAHSFVNLSIFYLVYLLSKEFQNPHISLKLAIVLHD